MYRRSASQRSVRGLLGAALTGIALLAFGGSASAAGDEAAWLFDPSQVVEVDLDLPNASIQALEAEPDEYQPASFTLKSGLDTYGPYEVGARLKGSVGSFKPLSGKAAFKVKFDEIVDEQTFFGLEKLTLNNMAQDPSMVHETLAYELFRGLGVPAPRTGYAFVRVNNVSYGVYLNVETLDAISLPRWFATTRHLYEGQVGLDVSPGAAPDFEVDEGKSSKREDLEALILAANAGVGDWSDGMGAVADLAEMTRMWAVERYIGHWDGYAGVNEEVIYRPNNYYLHSIESGLFRMLPWGTDQTWEKHVEFGETTGGQLFNQCLADASCRALYVDGLRTLQSVGPALDLDSQAAAIADLLAPWQGLELEPRREYSSGEIAAGLGGARQFIESRPAELAEWLLAVPASPQPNGGPTLAATAAPAHWLRIGVPRAAGSVVSTPLELSRPGQATQRVLARIGDRWMPACKAKEVRDRPGLFTLRCRLNTHVRQLRKSRPLRLRVRIGFFPSDGGSSFDTGQLTISKR